MLNLLICLHHPDDTLAVAATLRSPIVHLSYADVDRLLRSISAGRVFGGGEKLPSFLKAPAVERIQEIRTLFTLRASELLPVWLQNVYSLIPKAPYLERDDQQGRAIARILKVLREFQRICENRDMPPLVWLLNQRERAMRVDHWDTQLGEDVSISDESIDAVRVMTIHKAKGLEARCVILFDWEEVLDEASADPSQEAIIGCRESSGEIRGFNLPWGNIPVISRNYGAAYAAERSQAHEEARRLAYVAATRARESLIILTNVDSRKGQSAFVKECVRRTDPHLIEINDWTAKNHSVRPATRGHEIDREKYLAYWKMRENELQSRNQRRTLTSATGAFEDAEEAQLLEVSEESSKSSLVQGKVIHLYLEKHLDKEHFCEDSFETLLKTVDSRVDGRDANRASRILERFFAGELEDEQGIPFIERIQRSKILGREIPFFLKLEDRTWSGIIDLVVEEGRRIGAIDYKSGVRPDVLPSSYAVQENVYLEALCRLFPNREIRFEFWWLGGYGRAGGKPEQGVLPF